MPGLVLATKRFRPPPRPNALPRPGLLARLNEAQERGQALTLVSAPAGFGKSTLLSAWALVEGVSEKLVQSSGVVQVSTVTRRNAG